MSEKITIKTDNKFRKPIYSYELSDKELKDFDYLDADELEVRQFLRYRDHVYDLGDFVRIESREKTPPNSISHPLQDWDGYASDSFFSGIVIKWDRDCERVKIGRYYS